MKARKGRKQKEREEGRRRKTYIKIEPRELTAMVCILAFQTNELGLIFGSGKIAGCW